MAEDTPKDAPPDNKIGSVPEESHSSIGSSPEAAKDPPPPPEQPPPQKRKGGRKPIYATCEERKQRNRQAQAAFRERRSEYIKQLESVVKQHEKTLQELQQDYRKAADDCLMLKYKNSLLERILLENGIDVQAELHSKGANPIARPVNLPAPMQIAPSQRAPLARPLQGRRAPQDLAPKIDTGNVASHMRTDTASSTQSQATPPGHFSSPSINYAQSPSNVSQGDILSPRSAQQFQRHRAAQQLNLFNTTITGGSHSYFTSNPSSPQGFFAYQHANREHEGSSHTLAQPRPGYPPEYQDSIDHTGKLTHYPFPPLYDGTMFVLD